MSEPGLEREARLQLVREARERLSARPTGPRWLRSDAVDLLYALEEAQREIVRKDRKIASLEREQERLWKLINAAEAQAREERVDG